DRAEDRPRPVEAAQDPDLPFERERRMFLTGAERERRARLPTGSGREEEADRQRDVGEEGPELGRARRSAAAVAPAAGEGRLGAGAGGLRAPDEGGRTPVGKEDVPGRRSVGIPADRPALAADVLADERV